MARNPEYQFISTDTEALEAEIIATYEKLTGTTVHPASPEKLLAQWFALTIIQQRVDNNYTGNQNIPSRAEGKNLDALGELFYLQERPQAMPSSCTMRFTISEAQQSAILVPAGTRVTDINHTMVWATRDDAYIEPGETEIYLRVYCQVDGTSGNGFAPGQIDTIVDVFDYYLSCANTTTSDGGSDVWTDEEFYQLLRASMYAFSTAGPRGSYIYFARQVSTEIADVCANSPEPGQVSLYILMDDGSPASEEIKKSVLAACSADEVRPLTDLVTVADPEVVDYDVELTYYIPTNLVANSGEVEAAVNQAVQEYATWQSASMGRDINPSKLIGMLMQTGIKRVELTSPTYTVLRDGSDNGTPQVAHLNTKNITNGGREDE